MDNGCDFCDRTKLEERIVAEDRHWYVAATFGQITDGGYALIIPKKHIPCMGALTPGQTISALRIARKACEALAREYRQGASSIPYPVTILEHGIVGQTIAHAHLHLLPIAIDLTDRIRRDFPEAEIETLYYAPDLQERYAKRPRPYLFWTVPQSASMVCWNPPAPLQYLRHITAELLGRPERANWRTMDAKLDKQLWQETVSRLKPYFL